ncbi:MAG: hypothetical protein LBI86_12230, partial [Treponema sp.]|nr:hypothetical protein [Treponema sp.]
SVSFFRSFEAFPKLQFLGKLLTHSSFIGGFPFLVYLAGFGNVPLHGQRRKGNHEWIAQPWKRNCAITK